MQCSDVVNNKVKGHYHSEEFKYLKVTLKTCTDDVLAIAAAAELLETRNVTDETSEKEKKKPKKC